MISAFFISIKEVPMRSFLDAVQNRRSIYGLSNDAVVSDDRIRSIVEFAVKYSPSAFNSQTSRVIVLLGEEHRRFWILTMEALTKVMHGRDTGPTQKKIDSFAAGRGTVLFFEDQDIVKSLQVQFPTYAENFPAWSQQASGILQFILWTALEDNGVGASLQHYNPLVDDAVAKAWDVPPSWKLIAQMPFGKPTASADPTKTFLPVESRVRFEN